MERNIAVEYWRKNNGKDTLTGVLEDIKSDDTFRIIGSNVRHRALTDADVKETEVYVPSEALPRFFGDREYDSEGFMKVNTEVNLYNSGIGISFSAKGFGFGSVSLAFRHGDKSTLSTDTECMGLKTLTSIFRYAAPQLAQLCLERDPSYRSSEGLGSLDEDDAAREANLIRRAEEEKLTYALIPAPES